MIESFLNLIGSSDVIKVLMLAVFLDTILGVLRSIKYRCFNSAFGIDGAIRKVAMICCVFVLMIIDVLMDVNMIHMLPDAVANATSIEKVGMCEFFSILFIIYESVSILKNMYLCGLPVPAKIKTLLEKFLDEMTDEMSTVIKEESDVNE